MSLVVTCESCGQKNECGNRAPGVAFHCACGVVVRVPQAMREFAAAARCGACGAPRVAPGPTCTFCSAPFALLQDATTRACPLCEGPLPDGERFCAACVAAVLSPVAASGVEAGACPACHEASRLRAGAWGDAIPFRACLRCGGVFVGRASFDALADLASAGAVVTAPSSSSPSPSSSKAQPSSSKAKAPSAKVQASGGAPFYRRCVDCDAVMQRSNYARASGVVVDVCPRHGVWFDAGELAAVLTWLRRGGERTTPGTNAPSGRPAADDVVRDALAFERDVAARGPEAPPGERARAAVDELVGLAIQGLARWMRR